MWVSQSDVQSVSAPVVIPAVCEGGRSIRLVVGGPTADVAGGEVGLARLAGPVTHRDVLLRGTAAAGAALGRDVQSVVDEGERVSDELRG